MCCVGVLKAAKSKEGTGTRWMPAGGETENDLMVEL